MGRIRIRAGSVTVFVNLDESETAVRILKALPFEARARTWGREVYFEVPVEGGSEVPQAEVPDGAVAYWPPGRALCLFFGQTPYSPVIVVGRVEGTAEVLAGVHPGDPVRVEPA